MGYTVSSIFTAVDKFSAPLDRMQSKLSKFGGASADAAARIERRFNAVSRSASDLAVKTGAGALAIAVPLGLAVKEAANYESSIASLSAITGATGQQLAKFKSKVEEVGDATKMTYEDTAKAFELAGSAIPELLNSSDALGMVSKSAIILSKASGDELDSSIRSVTGVMNQFSLKAEESDRAINVLAAGAKVGAASIVQTAESMVNFGAVASSANMSVEQATAAIQVMGKFSLFGAEAGTKLRGSVLKLQQAGIGYASGQFQINDALKEAKSKIDKLRTAKEKDAAVLKLFGAENITTGKILLNNISTFEEYTKGVTGTTEAQIQAEIKSATMNKKLEAMRNQMQNLAVTIGSVLLPALTSFVEKMTPIVSKVGEFIKQHKGIVKMVAVVGLLLAVMSGISTVVAVVSTFIATLASLHGVFMVIGGFVANWIIPMFQALGAIIIGIVEIVAGMMGVTVGVFGAIAAAALVIVGIFISLYNHWDMITSAFKNGGIIGGLKAIGATLLDVILYPLQKILEAASSLPDFLGGGFAKSGAMGIEQMRADMGLTEIPKAESTKVETAKRTETNTNKNVTFDFKNVPKGMIIGGSTDIANSIMPNMGSTMGF